MGKTPARQVFTYMDGAWHDGAPPLLSPRDHGVWLASTVFDGARAIRGRAPDLDRHCERVIRSAEIIGLDAPVTAEEIVRVAWEGISRFPDDAELYISPMLMGTTGFIVPDADATRFVLTVHDAPIPEPTGFAACLSRFRRPAKDAAPTEAKASCLYPNVARSVREARARGFDVGIVLDPNGNVAEFSYFNLFMARGGVVHTPAANGTFLNGITRQRVIRLLRDAGVTVEERAIDVAELEEADEVFATGNYAKVAPCTRLEDRELQPGPLFRQARELYFKFAETA